MSNLNIRKFNNFFYYKNNYIDVKHFIDYENELYEKHYKNNENKLILSLSYDNENDYPFMRYIYHSISYYKVILLFYLKKYGNNELKQVIDNLIYEKSMLENPYSYDDKELNLVIKAMGIKVWPQPLV